MSAVFTFSPFLSYFCHCSHHFEPFSPNTRFFPYSSPAIIFFFWLHLRYLQSGTTFANRDFSRIFGKVCRALARVYAPPPLLALVDPSHYSPKLVMLPVGLPLRASLVSYRRYLCWSLVVDVASFFTNFGFLHGEIPEDRRGRWITRVSGGGDDVSYNFWKLSFLGFFCIVCLCVVGSKFDLGLFSVVCLCLWPIFFCCKFILDLRCTFFGW